MFRLNGDVIKQLEEIYGIKFKVNYRKELKERIVFFINVVYGEKSLNDLKLLKEEIVIKDFEIEILYKPFFDKYKQQLLTSFNPFWYFSNKKIYSNEEIDFITDHFIYDSLSELKDLYIDLIKPASLEFEVQYTLKVYKQIENNLNKYMYSILDKNPFKKSTFQIIYNFEIFLEAAEKQHNIKLSFEDFLLRNKSYFNDFASKETIAGCLFNLYYLNMVLVNLRGKHIHV